MLTPHEDKNDNDEMITPHQHEDDDFTTPRYQLDSTT